MSIEGTRKNADIQKWYETLLANAWQIISTLQLFRSACLVYLLTDVRPAVELGN